MKSQRVLLKLKCTIHSVWMKLLTMCHNWLGQCPWFWQTCCIPRLVFLEVTSIPFLTTMTSKKVHKLQASDKVFFSKRHSRTLYYKVATAPSCKFHDLSFEVATEHMIEDYAVNYFLIPKENSF